MIKMLSAADIITITNAVLGFLAIVLIFSNQFPLAAVLILIGLLADGLDGIVARRIGNGQMGEFLEAIADSISLSVAPLVLFYKIRYDLLAPQLSLNLLISVIITFSFLCCLLRLSSFSTLKKQSFFLGLPASANAIFLVMASFLPVDLWYILPFIVLFALLMISPIRFPKQGIKSDLIAAAFIVTAIILYFLSPLIASIVLLIGLILYIVLGPITLTAKKKNDQ